MSDQDDIFRIFCKYVDEHIFPEENRGTYVAFVVDQAFIDEFCKIHSLTESSLISAVRRSLYSYKWDHLYVKGILAIQLFAASKRANDGVITEKNYRDRLSQVLNWDINDLQSWMVNYQESIWHSFYDWCDSHYFQITKCERKTGTGRYIQYPVKQALRVFTEEDLKYIANCFVEHNLSPDEDLQETDFKRIIRESEIIRNINTNHGRLVVKNSISSEDYYIQVYNYFLRWNGEYKIKRNKVNNIVNKNTEQQYLYLLDNFEFLELRKANLTLVKSFDFKSNTYETLAKCYNFKRNGVILFRHDDVYDNYWQEVRFLEGQEEGLLLCFQKKNPYIYYKLEPYLIYDNVYIQIFKIQNEDKTKEFYGDSRLYELYGGLKIGRQTYLFGAGPTLRMKEPKIIWIDGELYEKDEFIEEINLIHLPIGHHYINIPGYKKLEFDIVKTSAEKGVWTNEFNKWHIDKRNASWESCKCEKGVVGLDYSSISKKGIDIEAPPLRRWTNLLTFGQSYTFETNATLRILKEHGNGRV